MKFRLKFPAVDPASDVVQRKATVKVGDADAFTRVYPAHATESEEMYGSEGETVTGVLVHVDDAANESKPRAFEFQLTDTIPPDQPGELDIEITSEFDE